MFQIACGTTHLARANVSVLIFVVAAYSGGFLKVPKGGGVSTDGRITSRGGVGVVHIGEVVDCKDMATDCEGLRIFRGCSFDHFELVKMFETR